MVSKPSFEKSDTLLLPDVWNSVADFLDFSELDTMRRVSFSYRRLTTSYFKWKLQEIQEINYYLFQKLLKYVPRSLGFKKPEDVIKICKNLKKLDFSLGKDIENKSIEKMIRLVNKAPKALEYLELPFEKEVYRAKEIEKIKKFKSLKGIAIHIDKSPLQRSLFQSFPQLEKISLYDSHIDDLTIQLLLPFKEQLLELDIGGNKNRMTRRGIEQLKHFTRLQKLEITTQQQPLPISLLLVDLKHLKSLNVSFSLLERGALEGDFSSLSELNLSFCSIQSLYPEEKEKVRPSQIRLLEKKYQNKVKITFEYLKSDFPSLNHFYQA